MTLKSGSSVINNPGLIRTIIQRAFPDIPDDEADEMASIGEIVTYEPGVVLCEEGEIESVFYIMLDGEVEVKKVINEADARKLKPLSPGDFFGEYALIHNAPRTATVTTTEPTVVLEISKDVFDRLLKRSTSVSIAMTREVSRRLRENDEMAIDDLRLKARELANAYQQLAELDYTRREFLTTIAHELRTPLTSASGYLHMIQSGALRGSAMQDGLETVSRNIQRIVKLVNDILFLQEMDLIFIDARPVEIGSILASAVEMQRENAAQNQVTLNLSLPPRILNIRGDQESLVRTVSALIDNAIKYSPNGGDVNISLNEVNGTVVVKIEDQGVGIPDDALPHIFDRYFHMENISGHLFDGAGLGLSIASQVVSQHEGSISVESELGAGSTFSIELPKLT